MAKLILTVIIAVVSPAVLSFSIFILLKTFSSSVSAASFCGAKVRSVFISQISPGQTSIFLPCRQPHTGDECYPPDSPLLCPPLLTCHYSPFGACNFLPLLFDCRIERPPVHKYFILSSCPELIAGRPAPSEVR